jgi:hypothetical protein
MLGCFFYCFLSWGAHLLPNLGGAERIWQHLNLPRPVFPKAEYFGGLLYLVNSAVVHGSVRKMHNGVGSLDLLS